MPRRARISLANGPLHLIQRGNNLEAGVIGTADKLIAQNWYLGEQ